MNTVDQRILIPTPPDVVWEYISDITKNPQWQSDCKSVTFLTSKRSGQGVRWRTAPAKGREQVIEITAWYDGLGYQYTYVDGMPFRNGTGRIRLQEIPEGTVVQWTIQYEMGGLLGGVRGSFGIMKQLETMMAASLNMLKKQVNNSGAAQNWREAKSLMRDAPDADARAHYKPRHPTATDAHPDAQQPTRARQPVIQEPPIAEDDTRPRPAAAYTPPSTPPQPTEAWPEDTAEPDFLTDLARFQPPAPDFGNDTQPIRTITPEQERSGLAENVAEGAAPPDVQSPSSAAVDDLLAELDAAIEDWPADSEPVDIHPLSPVIVFPERDQSESPIPPVDEIEPPRAAELPATEEPESFPAETAGSLPQTRVPSAYDAVTQAIEKAAAAPLPEQESDIVPQEIPGISAVTQGLTPVAPPDSAAMDTAQLSIWEIFGVQRPSDTEELRAITQAEIAETEAPVEESPTAPDPSVSGVLSVDLSRELLLPPQRVGLRLRLRRRSVQVRRPE